VPIRKMRSPHETPRTGLTPIPALKILEIAKAIEPVQDGRIHIEKINEPFLYKERGTPTEYRAGIKLNAAGSGCTRTAHT
jgi:hypothetical protein